MRQCFVEENFGALDEHVRPGAPRKWTASQEGRIIAITLTPAREGHTPLDPATAGGQGGRDGPWRLNIPRDGAPVAQKNERKP